MIEDFNYLGMDFEEGKEFIRMDVIHLLREVIPQER